MTSEILIIDKAKGCSKMVIVYTTAMDLHYMFKSWCFDLLRIRSLFLLKRIYVLLIRVWLICFSVQENVSVPSFITEFSFKVKGGVILPGIDKLTGLRNYCVTVFY